ncbi:hypothetical protein ACT3SZ_06335 [Corynebacterium sp. AOP40-9SA-29]
MTSGRMMVGQSSGGVYGVRDVVTLTVTGMASAGQREDVRSVLKEVLASV